MQDPDPRQLCLDILAARDEALGLFDRCCQAMREVQADTAQAIMKLEMHGVGGSSQGTSVEKNVLIDTLNNRILELEGSLSKAEKTKFELESGVNAAVHYGATDDEDCNDVRVLRSTLENLNADFGRSTSDYEDQLEKLRSDVSKLRTELVCANEELNGLKQSVRVIRSPSLNRDLNLGSADLPSDMQLRVDLVGAEQTIDEQRAQIVDLKDQVSVLQEEVNDGQSLVFNLRAEVLRLEQKLLSTESKLANSCKNSSSNSKFLF